MVAVPAPTLDRRSCTTLTRVLPLPSDINREVEMSSLGRHLIGPTAASLVVLFVVAAAFLAPRRPITDPAICATPVSGGGAEDSFLIENDVAMRKMMNDMVAKPTGDVDADFVAMMVPHHQGAIDMAVAVLRYGRNPQIKRLAQEIIVTQQQEIAAMHLAVDRPPPPRAFSLVEPSLQRIESKSSRLTERATEP
jgi:hypothetical protein